MQKYNFFYNKAKLSIIIVDEKNTNSLQSGDFILYQGGGSLKSVVDGFVFKQTSYVVYVVEKQKNEALKELFSFFKVEKAAGGIVENGKGEILVIKRFGYFDFPKGHMEAGESFEQTALREVCEETAVQDLHILHPLPETYHLFASGSQFVLKETHWFAMHTDYQGELKAQTEEKIETVGWFTPQDLCFMYPHFYQTLQDLLSQTSYLSYVK